MALTICRQPGCPTPTPTGLCSTHRRERDKQRPTRQQRGYDAAHDRERARLTPLVASGTVTCWRCGQPIAAGEAWDLGHTADRSSFKGPEHVRCNRATMGRERQP